MHQKLMEILYDRKALVKYLKDRKSDRELLFILAARCKSIPIKHLNLIIESLTPTEKISCVKTVMWNSKYYWILEHILTKLTQKEFERFQLTYKFCRSRIKSKYVHRFMEWNKFTLNY